ncbi:response regulator [Pontibacter sp. E15-1]|uniref:adenylate/guanylate cyclase domain-containing protein n=1 Tax=Pontibacter sp. E15-1 TaxID=2919918 RepID=UPI001F4F5472|nr:adenylate/guanylate cyclase domain-containing protein [Pontibacter sp. E15-1]MCJ8164197.1 response regulator [Pontibacter sp. E15-1]
MKANILVVDDEADLELLIKQKFRRQIRENTYKFVFAQNGVDALLKLSEHPELDIVLSDINMPEMDGLTLLTKIPESNPIIKTVIVSAYGDMENIRTAMNRGAFDFVCKPVDFEDLELTVEKTMRHVTQLRETVRAIKENDILKMYVDETVLHFMTHSSFAHTLLLNETIVATVLFMDICRFTAITERVAPNTVVEFLNRLFDLMGKEVTALDGHIDKFMGDAVMAVFRGDYHTDRAIEAALAVRKAFALEQGVQASDTLYSPEVSIGICSGEMVSGNIGSATLKRLDFTVIGDAVNMAQRLQDNALPGQIVIPASLYEQVKESFKCQLIGEVVLKNKSEAVITYNVLE